MSGGSRLNALDHVRNVEKESENSYVYDILSEGHLQAAAHRHRSYSMYTSKCLVQESNSKKRSNQQRRKSMPSNEAFLQKERSNTALYTDNTIHAEGNEQSDFDSEYSFRNRRARSFKERSEKGQTNHRRVRSFKTTSKGLVNRGDSFKVKRDADDPVSSRNITDDPTLQTFNNCVIPQLITTEYNMDQNSFKVLLTGARGVGKSSLIDQFMTSEFLGNGSFNVCK